MGPHLEIRPLMSAILMRKVCQVWMEEMLVPWAVVIGKGHVRLDLVRSSSEGSGTEGGKGSGKESKPDARIVNPNCSHFVETTSYVLCIPNKDRVLSAGVRNTDQATGEIDLISMQSTTPIRNLKSE